MAKIDYDRAKRRDQGRLAAFEQRTRKEKTTFSALRGISTWNFAAEHDLTCFKCKRAGRTWAKTGINDYGPWAICTDCVDPSKRRTKKPSG